MATEFDSHDSMKIITMGEPESGKNKDLNRRSRGCSGHHAKHGLGSQTKEARQHGNGQFCETSCLVKRYCEKRFISKYMATLGIDYGVTMIQMDTATVKVNIFDMGGQPFFYDVRNEFYKHTNGVILVFDVTNRPSFERLNDWIEEMKIHLVKADDMKDIMVTVCANKNDLPKRQVDHNEAQLWAQKRGYLYYETSAKTGFNVSEMFETLVCGMIKLINKKGLAQKIEINYTPEQVVMIQQIQNCEDDYDILRIPHNSSREDIIKAYKKLAILLHPDKNSAPGSEEAFKKISHAKDKLLYEI